MAITRSASHLIVIPAVGLTYGDNTVYYVDLGVNDPIKWQKRNLVDTFNAEYKVNSG